MNPIELLPRLVFLQIAGNETILPPAVESTPLWIKLVSTAIVVLLAWIIKLAVERTLVKSAGRIAKLRKLDDHATKHLVGRTRPVVLLLALVLIIVAALALLAVWGLENAFTGLLAGAGFAGIVIGLAAADTIGDVVAGFLIFYNNPFQVGDWVEIDGVQGIIETVGLGATTLITFDNEKVTIPNRIVEGGKVTNFSHARKLRRKLKVGVEYGSDIDHAIQILLRAAQEHPEVFADPAPQAVVAGFGSSSVDLELRYFVEPVRRSTIVTNSELVLRIHKEFPANGIGIAFPHMQIILPKESSKPTTPDLV